MHESPDYRTLMANFQYRAIRQWLRDNGSANVRPAADALKLLEEVLELCFVSGALVAEVDKVVAQETYKALQRSEASGSFNHEKASEEVGDTLLCIAAYMSKQDIKGIDVVEETLSKVQNRQWAPDYYGILRRPERLVEGMRLEDNKAYMTKQHESS